VIDRRAFIATVSGALLAVSMLAAPLLVRSQQAWVPRIGVLAPTSCSHPNYQALREGLRALGYIEGQTIIIECRDAGGRYDRVGEQTAELIRLKLDVLITDGLPAALAAKQATKTIPIILGAVGDPVGAGLVDSLARPGANITGLTLATTEMNTKRLEFLNGAVSGIERVALLTNPANPGFAKGTRETQAAARSLGLTIHVVEARGPEDLALAFAEMLKEKAMAVVVQPDPLLYSERTRVAALAVKNRLPAVGEQKGFAEAGGLLSYGPDITENFRRAATLVDKILKGAKPGDLPVEEPTRFELLINLKTAKALGLTIPQSLLVRADEVIQ
jgi:putative tryptophan/tyrosine transport system substrate-binding protein